MPTKHDFNPRPLPIFIDQPERQALRNVLTRAAISARILKASFLIATATAIGTATLSMGNPVTLFTKVTASLVDNSLLQRSSGQGTPTVQADADVQGLPPTAEEVPIPNQIALAESAGESQTENRESSSEALVRQFQAWAVDQDAFAPVGQGRSVQKVPPEVVQNVPVENVPTQIGENSRAPLLQMQKDRRVRTAHSAHAEIRPVQHPRKTVRREQNTRLQLRPVQDAGALREPVQNAQAPSFLPIFGQRN